jgi:hypothetical protein
MRQAIARRTCDGSSDPMYIAEPLEQLSQEDQHQQDRFTFNELERDIDIVW